MKTILGFAVVLLLACSISIRAAEEAIPNKMIDYQGFLQNAEMMRDRRLRKAQRPGQLTRADLALTGKSVDDRDPGWVGQRFEPLRESPGRALRQRRRARRATGLLENAELLH